MDQTSDPPPAPDLEALFQDEYIRDRLAFHRNRLRRRLRLSHHEAEDAGGWLVVELVRAAHKFNPRRSSWRTYVSRVLHTAEPDVARRLVNDRKRSHRGERLEGDQVADKRCADAVDLLNLRIDVNVVIDGSPRHVREILRALKFLAPSEAARQSRIHRSTLYRAIEQARMNPALRAVFREVFPRHREDEERR